MPSPNTPSLIVLLEKISDKLGLIGENRSLSAQCLPKHPRFNNNVKEDLPNPDIQIGALEPPLLVRLYIVSYTTNISDINKSEYGP